MDRRTKRQKLESMAKQSESPNEAEIAKKKLDEMGPAQPDEGGNTEGFITFSINFDGNGITTSAFEDGGPTANPFRRHVTFTRNVRFTSFTASSPFPFGSYGEQLVKEEKEARDLRESLNRLKKKK